LLNSVKNTTIIIWLNDGVYLQWKKLHVSAYSGHLLVLATFLLNSVKNTTINIWLNDGVYYQWKKLHVSAYSGHLLVVTTFLLNSVKKHNYKYTAK